jgi:glyoxylase-like metal-dependent hydrolase (beta-lactamase superfamily II)
MRNMPNDLHINIEILLYRESKPMVARVLLQYDILKWKYPYNGVWSYILDSGAGVIIYDGGPYFNTLLGNKGKLTNNTQKILKTIETHFDNKPIKQILLSHYHHDHSQNAADLQNKNKQIHGVTAPIRAHVHDYGNKKLLKVFKSGLDEIYKQAGFENVVIGVPLQDGEKIENTGFEVIHSPGHTHGTVSLVNHHEKVLITGWRGTYPNLAAKWAMKLINEDPSNSETTAQKLQFDGYKYFYLHKLGGPKKE